MDIDNSNFIDEVREGGDKLNATIVPINDVPRIALNQKLEEFPSILEGSSISIMPNDRTRILCELGELFEVVGYSVSYETGTMIVGRETEHLPYHKLLSVRGDEQTLIFRYEHGDVSTVEKIPWVYFIELVYNKYPLNYTVSIRGLGIAMRYLKFSDKWWELFPELATYLYPTNEVEHVKITDNEFIIGGYHIKYTPSNPDEGLVHPEE